MIRLFLRENRTTIILLIFLLGWLNLLLFLDQGFYLVSLVYLNGTLLFFGIAFFLFRFRRDRKKLQALFPEEEAFHQYPSYFALFDQSQQALKEETEDFRNQLQVEMLEEKEEQLTWIHEIKTPLTAMQLLLNQLPPSEEKSGLQVEWIRVHLLLDQTLHTLRLEEIERDYFLVQTTLKQLVLPEVKELQSWFFRKGLEVNIEGLHFSITTDEKWARFIVRQILSNAIKYSDVGGSVDIVGEQNESGQVFLTITDYGIGIPSQDIPRIFHKGFTGSAGRRQSSSTGMGLYLAQKAAKQLHMVIHGTSEEGKTTFTLTFPNTKGGDLTNGITSGTEN